MKIFAFFIVVFSISKAHAVVSRFNQSTCVRSDLEKIQQFITNYDKYHSRTGSTLTLGQYPLLKDNLLFEQLSEDTKKRPLLRMVESTSGPRRGYPNHKYVYISLQPTNLVETLKDANGNDIRISIYPKFRMECETTLDQNANTLKQHCEDIAFDKKFAVDKISIDLVAKVDNFKCKKDEYLLFVEGTVTTNDDQIASIKKRIVSEEGGLFSALIDYLFDAEMQKDFIKNYFDNLYTKWLKQFK